MGHEPVHLPLAKAVHDLPTAADALRQEHAALAVTSAEALRVLAAETLRPLIDLAKPLFAVGEATAGAATSMGFSEVHASAGDGADLAGLIAARSGTTTAPILYLAGNPRAKTLESRLAEFGIPFRLAEIYEMVAVEYEPDDLASRLNNAHAQALLLYSHETAIRFFKIVPADLAALAGTRILCISERTADAVPAAFRPLAEIAESPNETALLALL
ncbi:uroporphyrinogen-III synthase [Neorhizobium sp. NCHU2750]|nr:uroporphyrinogen-III synthase [Neorhizobium sp. NCHU2750]